jgi:hypothetical protein
MGESQHPDPGSGMNNPDHIFWSLETIFLLFWGLKFKFFDEDPGSGMEAVRIRDPGWKKVGFGINIPDSPHCLKLSYFSFYCICIQIKIGSDIAYPVLPELNEYRGTKIRDQKSKLNTFFRRFFAKYLRHHLLIAVVGVLIVVQNGDFIVVCFPLLERLLLVSFALSSSRHF